MRPGIEKAKASNVRDCFIPNPKLKLLAQVSDVMRFKHYSLRIDLRVSWLKVLFNAESRRPQRLEERETLSLRNARVFLRTLR